jgi:hypothetical protein
LKWFFGECQTAKLDGTPEKDHELGSEKILEKASRAEQAEEVREVEEEEKKENARKRMRKRRKKARA